MILMKRFGLIGNPISHSLSPALFRAGYHLDIPGKENDFCYDLIEGDDFSMSWQKFMDGYDGINVTAPFKEPAFSRCSIIDPACRKIGAANLIVKGESGTKAYNTDYYGIILSILEAVLQESDAMDRQHSGCRLNARPSIEDCRKILDGKIRTALVAGCGGAGKAAAVAATDLGLDTILMNRTLDKAEKTAEEIGNLTVEPLSSFPKCFHDADLIIYTLPAPVDSIASLQPDRQPGMKILLEANYRNPSFGKEFITGMAAENNGFKYVPGTRWLLYQAYAGYDLFTGKEPDLEAMAQVVRIN